MSGSERAFAFAGSALLSPDPARLAQLAEELGDRELMDAVADASDSLEPEYIRLFFNPAGSYCSLWQSAWCEEQHLMGAPHLRALEWYRRYRVEPAASNDPADHAGLLLLFYARLLAGGAEPEVLEQFARDHLDWLGGLCDQVQAEARHPFYRLLAQRTRAWLAGEGEKRDETEAAQ